MAFWDDISKFAGNLTGGFIGESDKEREEKERLKRQAAAQVRATAGPKPQQTVGVRPIGYSSERNNSNQNATTPVTGISNQATIKPTREEEDEEKEQRRIAIDTAYSKNLRLNAKSVGVKEYLDDFNSTDAGRQRRIRDELTKEATYSGPHDEGRLAKKQEASLLLAALEEKGKSKFDLGQEILGFGGNIVKGTVDMVSNLRDAGGALIDAQTTPEALEADYRAGRITRKDFLDRTSEANNRLEMFAGQGGKGMGDDALRAMAIATDAATTLVPIGSTIRGAKTGLSAAQMGAKGATKEVIERTLREAGLNAALSVPGAFSQGVDTELGDVVAAAGTGAVMGGVPAAIGSAGGLGYRAIKDRFASETRAAAEAALGRPLNDSELAELDNGIETEMQARVASGQIPADAPPRTDLPEVNPAVAIPDAISVPEQAMLDKAPQEWPDEYAGQDPRVIDNRAINPRQNNLLDDTDARARFGQPRDLGEPSAEARQVVADQEINARIAQLPDDNFIQQMGERFGLSEAATRRLLAQTNKTDLFRKLNDSGEFVRTANNPDAAATSIINKATDAGRAAAARAGVELPVTPKAETAPEAVGPTAAPTVNEADIAMDASGKYYNKTNGEYLPDYKPDFDPATDLAAIREMESRDGDGLQEVDTAPVNAATVAERTTALPDSRKATGADMPAIKQTQDATVSQLDNFETATTPEQRSTLMREIALHERNGKEISAESKALYEEYIKPVVDSLYDKSRRSGDMGRKQYYLPEEVAGTNAPEAKKFGSTWADEANMQFGHSMRREGKIDTVDLADPVSSLKNYVQQFYQDNYGHLTPENIAEAQGRGAIDGAAYLTGRRNVAEKLDENMVRSLSDRKAGKANRERVKATLSIAEDIRKNADATLDPETITHLVGGMSGTTAIRTNRKVAKRIDAGNGETVYERFGMRQFENAESLGNDAFEQSFTPGISAEEFAGNLHGYYDSMYEREFSDVMSPDRYHEIVGSGVNRAFDAESGAPLAGVEQALAMEKAIYASEHVRYSDKATQQYVDYEVGHLLRRGKMPSTIGRTIANNISRTFYSGALGLNPLSAIQNFTELSRVAGLTATKDTLKTLEAQVKGATPKQIKDTFKSYGIDSNRIRQEMTDELPTQKKVLKFAGKVRDKVEDTVMAGFNFTEATKNYAMIKALEIKHQDIADPRLRREAIMDDFNANSLIGGHYGNLVGVDRSNLARVAMQFGTYTLRDWGQIADRAKAGDAAYVARVLGTKAALAIPMYTMFGTSLAYTLGINEFKGGPAVSLTTELINSIIEENNRVQEETDNGKKAEFEWDNVKSQFSKKASPLLTPGGNYLFNKLGVQSAMGVDKEGEFLRTDTFIGDQKKGFNENKNGQPRFAAADTPGSIIRGIMGGAYNTDEAREYFGKDFWAKPQLFGLFDTNTQKNSPAYGRFQDKIEGQSAVLADPNASPEAKNKARATIRDTFDKAYESQDLKNDFFKANPEAASIYKEMTKATYNKETGKRESDVISPEKWKYVDSEKSGKLYDYLKNRAELNNKQFGDPIDPIYQIENQAQLKEVLNLRSSYTGDDKERKSMLYESAWYPEFQKKMSDYYAETSKQTYAEDSDYGKSKRAQEYIELSGKMPKKDPFYLQYTKLRYGDSATGSKGDEEAGKQFYKDNADKLNAIKEKQDKESFEWTNKMRVLEGATPLTWENFTNDSYGYKSGGSSKKFTNWGGKAKESGKTGVGDSITNYGGKATGPKQIKTSAPELQDVRKVVKQSRATKKAPIRITI